jgi:hypothetical protein
VQAARGHRTRCELRGQRAHRLAVDPGRIQEPGLLLQPVTELLRLLETLAHPHHRFREPADRLEHLTLLQIAQHLVPVPDSAGIVQRRAKERFQLVLLAPRGHRPQHLVKVQVGKEVRLLRLAVAGTCPRLLEQDALEAHPCLLSSLNNRQEPSATRGSCGEGQPRHPILRSPPWMCPLPGHDHDFAGR